MSGYGGFFVDTFVKLSPKANFNNVDAKIREIINLKEPDSGSKAFLHSVKDWHLRDSFENGIQVGGKITYVRLFTIIALIILLIACINFMNLATARSEKRANEVGVRKAMGSGRSRLITQFIFEALLLSTLATIISIFFILVILPQFNLLIEKNLTLDFTSPIHLVNLVVISIVCGLLAGIYPAFYLSSFKPVEVLKGLKVSKGSATLFRKALVVGQFSVSIILIVSTILVYEQIQHVKNRDLGYQKDQLLSIKVNGNMIENLILLSRIW